MGLRLELNQVNLLQALINRTNSTIELEWMIAAQGRNDGIIIYLGNYSQNHTFVVMVGSPRHLPFCSHIKIGTTMVKYFSKLLFSGTIKAKKQTNSLNFCNIEVI